MSETDGNLSIIGSQNNLVPVSSRKSSFKKRTKLEIILIIVVLVLVILLIFFFITTIILACTNKKSENGATFEDKKTRASCSSKECIKSAFFLLESMDQKADPCEDFYQFACGNWDKNHPVKELMISNSWFSELGTNLLQELKGLLKESKENNSEPNAVRQAKSLYKSCANTERLEDLGLAPIMVVLDNVSLPRQIPNSETANHWDIATTLALVQRVMSLDSLVQVSVDIDLTTGDYLMCFSPPTETPHLVKTLVSDPEELPKAIHLSAREAVKVKLQYMTEVLELMESWDKDDDYTSNVTSLATAALKIMLFSAKVELGITDEERNGTVTNKKMTIPALQDLMDSRTHGAKYSNKINWENYMTALLDGIDKPFDLETDEVSVRDVDYFENLAWLLANSHIKTIQRYVWWQVVEILGPHTNKAMRLSKTQMVEKFLGDLPRLSRSSLCVQRVQKLLPMAVSYTMAKKEDSDSTIYKVGEMFNDIRESFNTLVNEEEWINLETKKAAQEKADAIVAFIGYHDWLLKPGRLDKYYEWLYLEEDNYLYSMLKIKGKEVINFLNTIFSGQSMQYKNNTWNTIDPLKVNAFYVRQENTISFLKLGVANTRGVMVSYIGVIPAGILHFPFYGRGLEDHQCLLEDKNGLDDYEEQTILESLNYGSIGSILGHELTHGFDSEGKDYGKDGTIVPWWNSEMLKAYEDRARCFIKQYSEFGSAKNKVNGEFTLAENIADNGGIREAYHAYQKYKECHDPEPNLPGLEHFSHDQLLFLAFANMWCISEGSSYEEFAMKDSHSPARYRVLGSLSNSPEFSETWKCDINKTMNPPNKCIIW